MPKATVTTPFNYREGGIVKNYGRGEQDLTESALAHAEANGLIAKPKAEKKDEAAPAK
jgi:hypothetical protein